jgi:hypothetical protein
MANEDIEQRIKLTYETNADETSQEVKALSDNMDNVTDSVDKTAKATKNLEAVEKSFKTQMKEANEELRKAVQKFGETSKEAVTAAKRLAELKDQMQFAKDLTDNFNPDQKFKALGAATQIATTATSGLVSGYALLGDQGEDTQKMLLKVQAAMAFSDAISNLSNLGDQWAVFKTTIKDGYNAIFAAKKREIVVTEAQTVAERIKNAVMLANPYLALAAAVVAITIVTVAWIKSSNDAAEAQKKVADAVSNNKLQTDALKDSIDDYNEAAKTGNDIEVLRAKALGESDEKIAALVKGQKKRAVDDAFKADKEAYNNLLTAQENKFNAIKDGDEDLIKEAEDAYKSAESLSKQRSAERGEAINDEIKSNLQTTIEANNKKAEIAKTAAANRKTAREKSEAEEEAEKEAERKKRDETASQLGKIAESNYDAYLKSIEDAKKAFNDRLKTEDQKAIDEENAAYKIKYDNLVSANLSTKELETEHLNVLNDIKLGAQQKQYDAEKAIEDAKLAYKKELQDAEMNLAESGANFLSAIAGKNKVLQKTAILAQSGVGIARMIIANNEANIMALATPQAVATSGASAVPVIAFNNISTVLGVAANLAATAKALSSLGGGGSPGGAPANKSAGSPGGSAAPQVTFQGSAENQIANGVAGKINELPPIKTYVVQSEMTAAQDVAADAVSANSLGGN